MNTSADTVLKASGNSTGIPSKALKGDITAFYALSLPEFHMPAHSHESFEIMYVTAGSCTIFCENEVFRADPHHFVFIGSCVPHRLEIVPETPCSILNLEFSLSRRDGSLDLTDLPEKSGDFRDFWKNMPHYLCGADMRNLGYALKDLISQLQRSSGQSSFLLWLLLARTLEELAFCANNKRETAGLRYLRKACGYIEENIHEEIRVPDVAAFTGINKSYLQSLFSRFLGCSIIGYVNRKRMEEAAFLLTNSSMSITDIAFSTGYNSRQHFAHTFEKHYGTGPMSYRRLHARKLTADTGTEQYFIHGNEVSSLKLTGD